MIPGKSPKRGPGVWQHPERTGLGDREAAAQAASAGSNRIGGGASVPVPIRSWMFRYRNFVCQLYLMKYAIEIIQDIRDMKMTNQNIDRYRLRYIGSDEEAVEIAMGADRLLIKISSY